MKKFGTIAIWTGAIVLGSMLSISPCAEAQTDELGDEESVFFYEIPSIYAASKHDQKLTEAPSSISIITAEEIQMYGYRTLAEVLESVRGMFTSNDRNYSYLGIRGFARPGDYNTRVLILVDGIRLNDAVFDTGAIGTEMILDVDIIERVEIVRGPSSSLYGTNAFFGVVNIITKRGRDLQGPEFSGSAGSLETYKGRLSYGDKLANGVEIFLSGTYYESRGNEELYYGEFDDPETNYGIADECDSDEFLGFFGKISYKGLTLEGAHNDRDKQIPTGAFGTVFNDPGTHTTDEQGILSLKYDHMFGNQQRVSAMITYNHYYYYGAYMLDYGETEPDIETNEDYAKGDWVAGELQYTVPMYEKHHVIMGAEYRNNVRQNQGNYDIYETYLADERDSYYLGFFVNDEANLAEEFSLNIGARYDYFETFGGTINPRVAAVYDPRERTTLKALYGRAFRAPTAYELYYHDGGYSQKPGGDLEPETIDTYEFIVEQHLTDQIFWTVNGFFYHIDHLITLVRDPDDDLLVFRNVERIEAVGAEFGLEGRLGEWIRGRISYSYVETEDKETGEILTNSPKHLAKLNMIAPLVEERLFAAAEVQYAGEKRTLSGEFTDAFVVVNMNLSTQLYEGRVRASFGVYNLLDQEYFDPASEEHIQDAIMQNGRTFRASLTLSY